MIFQTKHYTKFNVGMLRGKFALNILGHNTFFFHAELTFGRLRKIYELQLLRYCKWAEWRCDWRYCQRKFSNYTPLYVCVTRSADILMIYYVFIFFLLRSTQRTTSNKFPFISRQIAKEFLFFIFLTPSRSDTIGTVSLSQSNRRVTYKYRRPRVYGLSAVIYKGYTTYRYFGIPFDLFRECARFKFSTIYYEQPNVFNRRENEKYHIMFCSAYTYVCA